ncbi:hypothetical protein BKA70DRAFT_90818 [Coprinopsis sp. MPI-PUGE-AT-0042]|nr:hypothetical protein BKA70DRAFT_90818 [Coprinopsis sp. MPI-PUGE-AT-0042]
MRIAIFIAIGLAIPSYAALTKGHILVKGLNWAKGVKLSTEFDQYDADIFASDSFPTLQVQMDLEKAQTTETNIEVLNGFWADVYPFIGISAPRVGDLNWNPPFSPYVGVINVQQTPDASLKQKENAFTACYPNSLEGLPYQASAIWRYDPSKGGKLTPTFLALNGTRLPTAFLGALDNGSVWFNLNGHSETTNPDVVLELFFIPSAE